MNKILLLLSGLLLLGQSLVWAAGPATLPGVDFADTPEWALTATQFGGKLLLSDSPEMVSADGITYQDTVSGDVRLFFHHVNNTDKPKKIFVLIANNTSTVAHLSLDHYGFAGPSGDYVAVGKGAQQDYLTNSRSASEVNIAPGKQEVLWNPQKSMIVMPNQLVNGIFDFKIDQPVTVKVIMVPADYQDKLLNELKVLPADDVGLRGTFEGYDKLLMPSAVYNPQQDGVVGITLADNDIDSYIIGKDMTTGTPVMNYGNYGVMYHVFLPSVNSNAKFQGFVNPRGGDYGGIIGIKYDYKQLTPVLTPVGQNSFGTDTIEAVALIGTYDSGKSLWFTFSPPGASNLPVRIMLAPDPLPDKGPGIMKKGVRPLQNNKNIVR